MSSGRTAAGRSCFECRRRKIRCDRDVPCAYCVKTRTTCVYPTLSQSRRSESGAASSTRRISQTRENIGQPPTIAGGLGARRRLRDASHDTSNSDSGQIVLDGGYYRYVTNNVWARLYQEASNKGRNGAYGDSSRTINTISPTVPDSEAAGASKAFPFDPISYSSQESLQPSTGSIFFLWQIYLENVDPLLKMIHVPTVQSEIFRTSQSLDKVPPPLECLMFSIYYAAVISMSPSECRNRLSEERRILLDRYRCGIRQALSKAHFLTSLDLTTLQAFVLYLICARRDDTRDDVWTLVSLAVRIATKLGLHRDGQNFHLPPFEIEMRRRIWWQIYILDVRIAEDNGMDPSIQAESFDTKMPTNVNDINLDPNMADLPVDHRGRTEMIFSLQRLKISSEARKIVFSPQFSRVNNYDILALAQKSDFIDELRQTIEEDYLKFCDSNIPFDFMTCSASRLILSRLKLTLYHLLPYRSDEMQDLSSFTGESLFKISVDILKQAYALRTHQGAKKWLWLFESYIEWDALAYVLIRLCNDSNSDMNDEAWKIVRDVYADWKQDGFDENDRRWRQIEKLKARAGKAREQRRLVSTASLQAVNEVQNEAQQTHDRNAELTTNQTPLLPSESSYEQQNSVSFQSNPGMRDASRPANDVFLPQDGIVQSWVPTPTSLLEQVPAEIDWAAENLDWGDLPLDIWFRVMDWEQRNSTSWL